MPECDSQPASHVAVAITLNAKASILKTALAGFGAEPRLPKVFPLFQHSAYTKCRAAIGWTL